MSQTNFVNALPGSLEPNSLYFVGAGSGSAEFYVSTSAGLAIPVATDQIIIALAQQKVDEVVGSAPGALDTLEELAAALLDSPDTISNLITTVGGKANVADVYTKTEVDATEASITASVAAKQDALSNADELAKFDSGAYDGDPLMVRGITEW